ncbi:fructokinase [Scopulibacillus darangshiensis]|uniref:fructokinase n=1 Tax=Scopulibacillus darangshiensis TaxID=442528 RepID=A0A4R2NM75_9BACL|nr:ROK family protein [Scopulibacillus darangshiensis]TCP22700.1 fructokinase [Scopulibacillus darangshiensis]
MVYGAIEAGGTKFVCAVGDEKGHIIESIQLPTKTPDETMPSVIDFFKRYELKALGIGSFGPVDVNKESLTYGNITSTPKPGWRDFPFARTMEQALKIPIGFNTDVNAAALGELTHGAAKGLGSCLYITVGTGIGGGAVVRNNMLQGLSHPEMGHILVRRLPSDSYIGKCPYHGDCLEGLAAGPAIEERWGKKGADLAGQPEVWELEAYYLAQALMQYILILSPEKIILGGGVMKQSQVFPLIREKLNELNNGYIALPELADFIVPPGLGDQAGITGALMLALAAE